MSFILIIIVERGCDYCSCTSNSRHVYEYMIENVCCNLARSNAIIFALQSTSGTYDHVVLKTEAYEFSDFCEYLREFPTT